MTKKTADVDIGIGSYENHHFLNHAISRNQSDDKLKIYGKHCDILYFWSHGDESWLISDLPTALEVNH